MTIPAALTAFCLVAAAIGQSVIQVPLHFPTIQQGVDAAVDGDVVLVAPGVYSECVCINKSIELCSESGAGSAHIVSPLPHLYTIELDSSGLMPGPVLTGFTIRDSNVAFAAVRAWGPAVVSSCVIRDNGATGIIAAPVGGDVTIDRCLITGNSGRDGSDPSSGNSCLASPFGAAGGIEASLGAFGLHVKGSVIAANTGGHAGFVFFPCQNQDGDGGVGGVCALVPAILENCTVFGNTGGGTYFGLVGAGGITYNLSLGPTLINSIVQGNSIPEVRGTLPALPPFTPFTVDYSNVAGYAGPGTGNIDSDPLLVDPMNGDYRLSANSPCIDAGDSTLPGLPLEDVHGSPRIVGTDVDMGAYEFVPPLLGTGEGLELRTTIDGFGANLDRKYAPGGSDLAVTIEDELGSLTGAVPVLLGQVFGNGTRPTGIPSFPLHLDLPGLAVFYDGNATPGPLIGAIPVTFGPVAIPPGLAGLTLRLQAFGLSTAADNAIYAATRARDLEFQ